MINFGIIYIATGIYTGYAKYVFESLANLKDVDANKKLYIITDDASLFDDSIEIAKQYVSDVKFNIITDLPYPNITMYKHIYAYNCIKNEELDSFIMLDADIAFLENKADMISNIIKHTMNNKVLVSTHIKYGLITTPTLYAGDKDKQLYSAGYDNNWLNSLFSNENPECTTYMESPSTQWLAGCFIAANPYTFKKVCDKLSYLMSIDLKHKIIPHANDESYLNKLYQDYCLGNDLNIEFLAMPYCLGYDRAGELKSHICRLLIEYYYIKIPKKHALD